MSNESKALDCAVGAGLNPHYAGNFNGESDELKALRLALVAEIESLRAQLAARVPEDIFAWATFDGEGGYDLRLYENNESYRDDYINCNGAKYASWVIPLSAAPSQKAPQEQRLAGFVVPTHFDPLTGAGIPDPTTFGKAAQQAPVAQGEPVATVDAVAGAGPNDVSIRWRGGFTRVGEKLYTTPQQASEPMTDERVSQLIDGFDSRIETAKQNGDGYDAGYLGAMKAMFVALCSDHNIKGKQ